MSVSLLLLFSIAMLSAIAAKVMVGFAGIANVMCLCLLALFVIVMRYQGVRKPVI